MLKTYDPKQVNVIAGPHIVGGFSADSKVTVEYDEDAYTKQTGVDGEATRSKSNNLGGKITINLMQGSDSNDFFSGLAEADRLTGAGIIPIFIQDKNGTSLHTGAEAWVLKVPASAYEREAGSREWIFDIAQLLSHVGSNNTNT